MGTLWVPGAERPNLPLIIGPEPVNLPGDVRRGRPPTIARPGAYGVPPLPSVDIRTWRPRKSLCYGTFTHRDRNGNVLWERTVPNLFHDEGERWLLANSLDTNDAAAGVGASIYAGLRSNSAAETDTLASGTTELASSGYARQAVSTTTGHTLTQVGGDWRATSGTITWTNNSGGAWTGAVAGFICTVSSGTSGLLIASFALTVTRTLQGFGDSMNFSYYVSVSE